MSALKVKDVAERLGVSTFTVHGLIHAGELPAANIGTGKRAHWRIERDDFDAYVARAKQRTAQRFAAAH